MDRKQMCVANVRYKRPSMDEARRMKSLLGYLTYRESRDKGAKMMASQERWVDHGMGRSVAEIARRCDDLRSDHVLAFSLVINPNPQLVAMIPHEEREQFVRELTESVVEDFFETRGIDTGCEFSFVLHHRESDDPQTPGLHNPHTHVVLPGTVWSEEHGERVNLYFSQNKKFNHIEMLHRVTEGHMEAMMERYVGQDWEQRIDALEALRESQKTVTDEVPHGFHTSVDERVPFWAGVRQVDEESCAVGYYLPVQEDKEVIEFRPIRQGLDRAYAERLTQAVVDVLRNKPDISLEVYREMMRYLLDENLDDIQSRQTDYSTPTLNVITLDI